MTLVAKEGGIKGTPTPLWIAFRVHRGACGKEFFFPGLELGAAGKVNMITLHHGAGDVDKAVDNSSYDQVVFGRTPKNNLVITYLP